MADEIERVESSNSDNEGESAYANNETERVGSPLSSLANDENEPVYDEDGLLTLPLINLASFEVMEGARINSMIYADNEGYIWNVNKPIEGGLYLHCNKKNKKKHGVKVKGCPGTGMIRNAVPTLIETKIPHTHPPSPNEILCRKSIIEMKRRAGCEKTEPKDIFLDERRKLIAICEEAGNSLSFVKVSSTLSKIRSNAKPKGPIKSADEFYLALSCVENHRFFFDETQMRFDKINYDGDKWMLVFSNVKLLNLIKRHNLQNCLYHFDGTFKCCPKYFSQVYNVMLNYSKHAFPVFMVLMMTKSKVAYVQLLTFIGETIENWVPKIMSDFESGFLAAVQESMPQVQHRCCWFHFTKAVLTRAKDFHLIRQKLTCNDHKDSFIIKFVKATMALPLLPATLMRRGLNILCRYWNRKGENADPPRYTPEFQVQMTKFLEYIQAYWIDKVGPERLSVYGKLNRTNNLEENYHSQINKKLPPLMPHWDFVSLVTTSFTDKVADLTGLIEHGIPIGRKQTSTDKTNDNNIKRASRKLWRNEYSIKDFLLHLSHATDGIISADYTDLNQLEDNLNVSAEDADDDDDDDDNDDAYDFGDDGGDGGASDDGDNENLSDDDGDEGVDGNQNNNQSRNNRATAATRGRNIATRGRGRGRRSSSLGAIGSPRTPNGYNQSPRRIARVRRRVRGSQSSPATTVCQTPPNTMHLNASPLQRRNFTTGSPLVTVSPGLMSTMQQGQSRPPVIPATRRNRHQQMANPPSRRTLALTETAPSTSTHPNAVTAALSSATTNARLMSLRPRNTRSNTVLPATAPSTSTHPDATTAAPTSAIRSARQSNRLLDNPPTVNGSVEICQPVVVLEMIDATTIMAATRGVANDAALNNAVTDRQQISEQRSQRSQELRERLDNILAEVARNRTPAVPVIDLEEETSDDALSLLLDSDVDQRDNDETADETPPFNASQDLFDTNSNDDMYSIFYDDDDARRERHFDLMEEDVAEAHASRIVSETDALTPEAAQVNDHLETSLQAFKDLLQTLDVCEVEFSRETLVENVLMLYKLNEDIVGRSLRVRFINEQGVDLGGVSRDMFSTFWRLVYHDFFIGEGVLVPSVPINKLSKAEKTLPILGKIFSHSTAICNASPLSICGSSLVAALFGVGQVTNDILFDDFLAFLAVPEQQLLNKAIHSFPTLSTVDKKFLLNFFATNNVQVIPRSGEAVKENVLLIAKCELLHKPSVLMQCFYSGFPDIHKDSFWNKLHPSDIAKLCNVSIITPEKIIARLKTESEDLTFQENKILYFIEIYLRSCSVEMLKNFTHFVTGMFTVPKDVITIRFVNTVGESRLPKAHTCDSHLDVSTSYTYQHELVSDFDNVLGSEEAFKLTDY